MATPSKRELIEKLTALHVEIPEGASSQQLQTLYKKVKDLPSVPVAATPRAQTSRPTVVPPPLRPHSPLATAAVPAKVGAAVTRTPLYDSIPAVPAPPAVAPVPVSRSDHDTRGSWDPFAGW